MNTSKIQIPKSRAVKLFIKRNKKLIYNPKILLALKKPANLKKIILPDNFSYDKKNNKIIKIRNGKRYTQEFKSLELKEKRKLKYYGKNIYDRIDDKVINRDLIYKKKKVNGVEVLRKKYETRIVKNNQLYKKVVSKPKPIKVNVLFEVNIVRKYKPLNGEWEYKENTETKVKNYDMFKNTTSKKVIQDKINEDGNLFWNVNTNQSGILIAWNGSANTFSQIKSKYIDEIGGGELLVKQE